MTMRMAQLAGAWYPASESECLEAFAGYETDTIEPRTSALHGGIIPHAGWVFSGRIAYNVLHALRGRPVDTVVLFAGHLRPGATPRLMTHGECWTPLGTIRTDEELAREVAGRCPTLQEEGPADHTQDNSVEVQLPLIKHFFADAHLLIVGAPPHSDVLAVADAVVESADKLGRKLLPLGSTDLTHYGPNYGWAPRGTGEEAERWVREQNDPLFIDAVRRLEPQAIIDTALTHRNACCPGAAAAAAHCVKRQAGAGELLHYATSAEVHRASSFVGYAGIVF